jgi:hypothetical protein
MELHLNSIGSPSAPWQARNFQIGQTRSAAFLLGMGCDRVPGCSNSVSSRVASHRPAAFAIIGSKELRAAAGAYFALRGPARGLSAGPRISFHRISSIVPMMMAVADQEGLPPCYFRY